MKKILLIVSLLFICVLTSCGEGKAKYTVKFVGVNDEVISTVKVTETEEIVYPNIPEVEGYKIIGWEKEIETTNKSIVIKAKYERLSYIVVFYDNNDAMLDAQVVYYGDSAIAPSYDMNISGASFVGWDKELTNVTSDLEVRPIYQVNTYVVKFYDALGSVISEQIVEHGKYATAPDNPEKEGATFIGWDTYFYGVTSNLDVYPKFEDKCYEVSFYDMYGNLLSSECIKHGFSANPPEVPTIPYYTFTGWDQEYDNITSNKIIRARYTKETNNYSFNTADYWLHSLSGKYDIRKLILTEEEINAYNAQIVSTYSKTKVIDLRTVYKKETGIDISNKITVYTKMNSYTIYNNTTHSALSSSEKTTILNNRNLNNIPSVVTNEFGIVTSFAWLRAYPTNCYAKDYDMDRFQETTLNVGEGVVISHISSDGLWYFVQAQNYNGWIETKYVAKCSYDEMISFLYPTNRLVVISDYVKLETEHVRMGQSFPLVSSNDDSYVINFPKRLEDGTLSLKELTLAKSDDYHEGYLEYTYENVFKQAFKLLGIDYSWGDKETSGRDCSSTMNGIYCSFGFMMPRNTSNQLAIPTYGKNVSGLTVSSLKTYYPGTLIYTSSHVMMYIGENINGVPYLLHNTTSNGGGCILQSFESYGGSKMIAVLKMQ